MKQTAWWKGSWRRLWARLASAASTIRIGLVGMLCAIVVHTGWALSPELSAAPSMITTPQVQAQLIAYAPQGVQAGQPLWLGLLLKHQPQWHTYWKNSGDSGQATQLAWQLPKGWLAGDIAWPTPKKMPIGPLANYGYEGEVLLPVSITLPQGERAGPLAREIVVGLKARWLVCRLECIPEEGDFELRLPLHGPIASEKVRFEHTFSVSPKPFVASASSGIVVKQRALHLTVDHLPLAWQGHVLSLYPETSEVIDPAATVQQSWQGSTWRASVALARHQTQEPSALPLVLANPDNTQALALSLPIQGLWPPPSTPTAVIHNASQPLMAAPDAGQFGWGFGLALIGALMGGLLLNLMPCVFPILAIKVLQLVQSDQTIAARQRQALAYTAGVLASVLLLGGVMLVLRAAGESVGWGFQLQNPWVVMALAALFVAVAINLLGGFEVGQWWPSAWATTRVKEPAHPMASALLTGVLTVAVASPCSAPFMGAAMGLAITWPAWQALSVFAALGVGLALPFLIVGWMPRVASRLPRPGAWMQEFKHFLAYPMLATVVWLVWVLGQQNGLNAAVALLVLLVTLAMLLWAYNGYRQKAFEGTVTMGRRIGLAVVAGMAVLVWAIAGPIAGRHALPDARAEAAFVAPDQAWQVWSGPRVADALAIGQPVLVDYTAAWCVTCQVNKTTTLTHPKVLAALAQNKVLLLRADWTRPNNAIAQSIASLGRSGVPVYALYWPGQPVQLLPEILTPGLVLERLEKLTTTAQAPSP